MKWMSFVFAAAVLAGALGCSTSSSTDTADGKLTITPPDTLSITQGESKDLVVDVDRPNTDDDVTIKLDKLPEGVKAKDTSVKVKKGEKKATFNLTAEKDAKESENFETGVTGTYKGKDAKKTVKVTVKKS